MFNYGHSARPAVSVKPSHPSHVLCSLSSIIQSGAKKTHHCQNRFSHINHYQNTPYYTIMDKKTSLFYTKINMVQIDQNECVIYQN